MADKLPCLIVYLFLPSMVLSQFYSHGFNYPTPRQGECINLKQGNETYPEDLAQIRYFIPNQEERLRYFKVLIRNREGLGRILKGQSERIFGANRKLE